MLLAAIAVRLESSGPVFFSHTRLGRNGRPFRFVKFRSMCEEAVELRSALDGMNQVSGPVFKIKRDPRVTTVGRFLRRASIDELPQLWHVLAGDMSLVGPRPPVPEEVADYEPWMLKRLRRGYQRGSEAPGSRQRLRALRPRLPANRRGRA